MLCLLQDFPCVAVVGLDKLNAGVCGAENWDASKENVRQAVSGETLGPRPSARPHSAYTGLVPGLSGVCVVPFFAAGCRLLQDLEVNHVEVDGCGDAQAAAEGAALGLFHYDELKSKKKTKATVQLHGRSMSGGEKKNEWI